MTTWTDNEPQVPFYLRERLEKALVGRQRRRRAWVALGVAVFVWMTVWGGRNLLG